MNPQSAAAAALASRHYLKRTNPDLLAWTRRQWDEWLRSQNTRRGEAGWPLTVAARLSSLEDLDLQVGLMQVLRVPWLRCTLVLSFPSEQLARIASTQARREGWGDLVQFVVGPELDLMLDTVPANERVATFSLPSVLGPDELEILVAVSSCEFPTQADGFALRAREFGAATFEPQSSLLANSRRMAALDPVELDFLPKLPRVPPAPAPVLPEVQHIRSIEINGGSVEIASSSPPREMVIIAEASNAEEIVIARRRLDLLTHSGTVRIRVPPCLLTMDRREIRIETTDIDGRTASADIKLHIPPSKLEPWMLSAFVNRGGAGNPVVRAFAEGVGCRIAYAEDEPETLCDIPVVWGVLRDSDRILAQAKAQKLYFFYIDHAYFDRGHGNSYRITRNAYEAGRVRRCPEDRLAALGLDLLPWRKSGREIIVCPPTDYFMRAHGCEDWLERTIERLNGLTDRPIVVREKPKSGGGTVPLPKALETAHALVTHSSNIAIEAACLGTPVFVASSSAAAPVGCTDLSEIESPIYPDRDAWLAHLAYNQFTFDEIGDGRAWHLLLELEERDFV